jgi:hypothetical protein
MLSITADYHVEDAVLVVPTLGKALLMIESTASSHINQWMKQHWYYGKIVPLVPLILCTASIIILGVCLSSHCQRQTTMNSAKDRSKTSTDDHGHSHSPNTTATNATISSWQSFIRMN